MNYAFTNGKILDGSRDMQPQSGLCILVRDGLISDIVPDTADLHDYTAIDLHGSYILPGLINMHVHLAGNGKPQKKQRDNEKLVNTIMSSALTRTVGGLGDFDTRLRDEIEAGQKIGPRILASNQGISVPGGHMAGSVAIAAASIPDALNHLAHAPSRHLPMTFLSFWAMMSAVRGSRSTTSGASFIISTNMSA